MRSSDTTICWILLLFYLLTASPVQAQSSAKDSLFTDSGYAAALQKYHSYASPEPALYRGPQYVDYEFTVQKGQPFFGSDTVQPGSLWYDGIFYDHLPLEYDMVLNQVVINDPYKIYKIALLMDLAGDFSIGDHYFIRVQDSLNPTAPHNGYYERLYQGKITLLKKEKKAIQENLVLTGDNIQRYIETTVSYYFRKGTTYYSIPNKKALMAALKDRKADVKKYIRQNNLSWRDDKEQLLLKVTAWYDTLNS